VNCRYDFAPELELPASGGQRAVLDAAIALHRAGRAFALAGVVIRPKARRIESPAPWRSSRTTSRRAA
jgi:hypothetical protein